MVSLDELQGTPLPRPDRAGAAAVGARSSSAASATVPASLARARGRLLPAAEFRAVPSAGHVGNLENPDAFTAALRDFLDR